MRARIILFNRIRELERSIQMYERLLEKYPTNKFYQDELKSAKDARDLSLALYHGTGVEQ